MDASNLITPALGENAVALPDMPSRSESRSISLEIEITVGNTVAPPRALVLASVPDTATCPWPIPFWNCDHTGVVNTARQIVEHGINRPTILDGLETVLRKQANQRVLFSTMNDITPCCCDARPPTDIVTSVA
jgi:hypothetical protein